ncbi:MAG: sugar transferase [Bacteroidetes bacterium]|nr:sugar transferase [Bacteroidota bacterium]
MNKNRFGWLFAIIDFVSTGAAWTLFYTYRKTYIEPVKFGIDIPLEFTPRYFLGIAFIPTFWVLLYYLIGSYKRVYRRSRLKDLANTVLATFFGSVAIFFIIILDDTVYDPSNYRSSFFVLFALTFLLRYWPRYIWLTSIKRRIKKGVIGFNSILVGSNERALNLYNELKNEKESQGYLFRGYVTVSDQSDHALQPYLAELGTVDDLQRIIVEKNIEEVIIAVETSQHKLIEDIIDELTGQDVMIKVIPDMYDIVSGRVKMRNIFGAALIEIWPEIMPPLQKNVKRMLDIVVSVFVMIAFSWLYLILMLWVKLGSKGPIFYSQERIGYRGVPFQIVKFRTMVVNAETEQPQLSSKSDSRITNAGKILRKYRLDEIPQFYNVLIGEMSLVGPRPERQFFIDQIQERAPHFRHLHKVKPGITSWGQVKFGYAENVDQMVERLKYDLLYLENMSLATDFKILAYTVLIILKGSGK